MSTFVDDGIVLRRVNYGEADRILTVLTREHGKLSVIARGVRKNKARMTAQTDILMRSRMQLATGRGEMLVLTQAQSQNRMAEGLDAVHTACAAVVVELADLVLEPRAPDEAVFELVADSLDHILAGGGEPRAQVIWCARLLMDYLGYAPQLHHCAGCSRELSSQGAWFSAAGGGLLCDSCSRSDLSAVECSSAAIKVLRCVEARETEMFSRLRWGVELLTVLEMVMERELAQHLERRVRSLEVLRALSPSMA